MRKPDLIYLDHHATTPLDPRVRDAMAPYLGDRFGNPHSRDHAAGWRAGEAVDAARREIASAVGALASEIIFTSGATEANNLAIQGVGGACVTTAIEHPSVLRAPGAIVVPVDPSGIVEIDALEAALTPDTRLVSVALVNHEIGVVQPTSELAALCRARNILLHTDCAQALGKIAVDVAELGVDLASFSAHKAYGPMGIGALFVRSGVEVTPILHGGGQEMGIRPGTVPLPLAVGFGAAARIASESAVPEAMRIGGLRDRLLRILQSEVAGLRVNGSLTRRVAGNLNVTLPGVEAESLLLAMPDLALSSGAACASGSSKPSVVLQALGLDAEAASCSIRLCLGRFTTEDDIDRAGAMIVSAWRRLKTGQA